MLSVCEGGSVITLDQVETRDNLRVVSDIGSRLPIYCTSQGKVFLAHMSRTSAEALLRAQHMTQFTLHTITDLTALMQEIDLCRTDGYAIENGEYKIGLRSISAPVYTVEGKARYTVGVIGMFRSTRSDEFLAAVEQVCATASMISLRWAIEKRRNFCKPYLRRYRRTGERTAHDRCRGSRLSRVCLCSVSGNGENGLFSSQYPDG